MQGFSTHTSVTTELEVLPMMVDKLSLPGQDLLLS